MSGYVHLGILIATIVLPVALIIAVFRARRSRTATPIVRVALIVSATWAGLALIIGGVRAASWFTSNTYPFFDLRAETYWPVAETTIDGPGLVWGGFTVAEVSASGLSMGTRTLLAAGDMTETVVTAGLASLIAFACVRLIQERPFAPEVARLALIAAALVLVGGVVSQFLLQSGGIAATNELIRAGAAPEGLVAASAPSIDYWPVFAAIGLGALGAVFRYGTVLQRETEGLV